VIPLAILRNGFRILVIGLLCVNVGPQMIHSVIHRSGGPIFFVLSLIPLLLLLWWLRKGEVRTRQVESR
jgi:exosortase/archaeosortase family protein